MARTTRVPHYLNLFDLVGATRWRHHPEAEAEIAAWERRRGTTFPPVLREFYTTSVTLRLQGEPRDWSLTLPLLWSEFSDDDIAPPLEAVLDHQDHPLWWDDARRPEVEPGPHLLVMNGRWYGRTLHARLDGTADPPVYAEAANFLSPEGVRGREGEHWHGVGRFSDVLFRWVLHYYDEPNTPASYAGDWQPLSRQLMAPAKPHLNGLWLRSPAEPLVAPALDFLTEQLGEPDRVSQPGDVTTYTFRADGGIARVTADALDHPAGRSAWWLHADTPDRLAALARLVLPFGTLRGTLRADTDPGRAVLAAVRGS